MTRPTAAGSDSLLGEDGADELYGDDGVDFLYGDGQDDRLDGGEGNDFLEGGSGNDEIYGRAGVDTIWGGSSRDRIEGGLGADLIFGDSGADTFVYTGADLVTVTTNAGSGKPGLPGDPTRAPMALSFTTIDKDIIFDFQVDAGFGFKDKIDVSALLDAATNFSGTTAQQALSSGYVYGVTHGTPGEYGYGTTLYIDRDGGLHNPLGIGGARDLAFAELEDVAFSQLTAAHFVV